MIYLLLVQAYYCEYWSLLYFICISMGCRLTLLWIINFTDFKFHLNFNSMTHTICVDDILSWLLVNCNSLNDFSIWSSMRWFEGDVVAAIAETKRLGALFVVYIQGGKEAVSLFILHLYIYYHRGSRGIGSDGENRIITYWMRTKHWLGFLDFPLFKT